MKTSARSRKVAFIAVWEFYVQPQNRRAFQRAYGPQGAWAKLFKAGRGYIRTELIRDLDSPNRCMTLDYWKSYRQYENFRKNNRAAYLAIDEKCSALTTKETEIGRFTTKW